MQKTISKMGAAMALSEKNVPDFSLREIFRRGIENKHGEIEGL